MTRTLMPWQVVPPTPPPQALKITANRGRLLVSGPGHRVARKVKGAIYQEKKNVVWLSLTLDSLRRLRKAAGVSAAQLARWCAPEVLAWARAAGKSESLVDEVHRRLENGWRETFPWQDLRAHTAAPPTAPERDTYTDEHGVRRWSYRTPFDHQEVMATVASLLDGTAYLCDMGTGKTRAAVEALSAKLRANTLDLVVVVCPKGVMGTWERECMNWSDVPLTERLTGRVTKRGERLEELRASIRGLGLANVVVVNYDVLYLLEDDLTRLFKGKRVGFILDEGHRVRNPQAKVTKAAMRLATVATWRLHMTGTLILQGAQDVWSQWYVVDLGVTFGANWVQFRGEFFDESEYDHSIDPLDGALDEIGMRLRRRGLRYRKDDCLDLPPKMYQTIDITLTPQQQRAYREMEEWLLARLEEGGALPVLEGDWEYSEVEGGGGVEDGPVSTAANQLAMILRLTQITSGFLPDETGTLHRFSPNPKLDALAELVSEQIGSQQIIVWARYREDVRAICERLHRYNPLTIDGSTPQTKRDEAELLFQRGECRLLVANPAAGGVGLNLQAGSLAIYYSQGYSLEHRLQSEDRCHRSGSQIHEKVTYIDLIAQDTIDVIVRQALSDKKEVAEIVVDLKRMLQADIAAR